MTDAKKQQIKKISGITLNVLLWIFVVFSLLVTILVFAAQGSKDGIPALFGKSLITIESPSMSGTYEVGDLVFMEKLSDDEKKALETDMIITYRAPIDINGDGKVGDINTHRIKEHNKEGGYFITKGDANDFEDQYKVYYNDVIGLCEDDGKIGGLGNVINFLRSSLGFFLCIVLPLILFFIYELYNFISLLLKERAKNAPVSKEAEEEIKRRAIEEYLKNQAAAASKEEQQIKKEETNNNEDKNS